ncbi:hypothetical protein NKR23_g12174 [Pleurostoma richardsiae]|uniref:Uncharacterized protein n=1 Tax=Pleurostoma richardsiae TaxID=41990 RepID=A0AA38VD12_9PEZI|nr:hypothetical protein NKR23_g12174 [Pleurostoma richardsiae]
MGTRGLYSVKFAGKYYVYYNHWDSDRLGDTLTLMIPLDPAEAVAGGVGHFFDDDAAADNRLLSSVPGTDDLRLMPGYVSPGGDLFLEHTYVIDLDRQIISFNKVCHFRMAELPSDVNPFLQPANEYWLGLHSEPAAPCITTDALPPPTTDRQHAAANYDTLVPQLLSSSPPTTDPAADVISVLHKAYQVISETYAPEITQARDTSSETDVLFREVSYALLSIASCSPDRVRPVRVEQLGQDANDLARWKYGILGVGSDEPRELVARFLSDYHEVPKTPGSAPPGTSYWLGPVLVHLERSLLSRESFQAAICAAVGEGRSQNRDHFQAVVFSIRHFVLIHVTPSYVSHSLRYPLWTRPVHAEISYVHTHKRAEAVERHVNYGGPDDADWVAASLDGGFESLMRFFLNANSQATHTLTGTASTALSLAGFGLHRYLKIIRTHQNEPRLRQVLVGVEPAEVVLRRDQRAHPAGRKRKRRVGSASKQVHCMLVIQASSDASTPSLIPVPVLWKPWQDWHPVKVATDPSRGMAEFGDPERLKYTYLQRRYDPQWRRPFEAKGIDWAQLDAVLDPPNGSAVIARPVTLAVLYALVFFIPLGIAGCGRYQEYYAEKLGEVHRGQIPRQSLNSHLQMAGRILPEPASRVSVYYVALFKPASEDTPAGWARAEAEGRKQAELEYFREAFALWMDEKDTAMHDLALFVVIGTKFKLFHVSDHPRIPTMKAVALSLDLKERRKRLYLEPWKDTNIPIQELRCQLRFSEVPVMAREGSERGAHYGDDDGCDIAPFDVRETADRHAIEATLAWTRQLADARGDQLTEELVELHPYRWH